MVKFHIHKCKFLGVKTCFIVFKNELKHYIESILPLMKQKAIWILQALHSLMYFCNVYISP